MKIINLLASVLIVVAVLSVTSFVTSAPTYVTYGQNIKHYNDSEISFNYPENWIISNYENPVETFFSSKPQNLTITRHDSDWQNSSSAVNQENCAPDPSNPTMTTVNIKRENSLSPNITLENAYRSNDFYPVIEQSPGYTFISQKSIMVDGAAGYEFIYGNQLDQYYDVWFEKNGKIYSITCETLKESFDAEKKNFDMIVNSFHVK